MKVRAYIEAGKTVQIMHSKKDNAYYEQIVREIMQLEEKSAAAQLAGNTTAVSMANYKIQVRRNMIGEKVNAYKYE